MNESGKPNLYRLLKRAISRGTSGVRVSLPGIIVSYDKTKQRADIQTAIADAFTDEDGARVSQADPILTDVPIAFPGAGGYGETWPIAKGDTVLIVWCSRSIAQWKPRGSKSGRAIDPGDDRRHAFPDAVAYAGVRDYGHALSNVNDDAWCIRVPSGKFVKIGGPTATQSVLRGEAFLSALSALTEGIRAALVSAGNTSSGGAAIGTTFEGVITAFETAAGLAKSSKVKIE